MPFSDSEIAEHVELIERIFWTQRRPPLHLRDKIREGQRIQKNEVELFFVRPAWHEASEQTEEPIAKARYVRSRKIWKVYWMRADLKWHSYPPQPEVETLDAFLRLVDEDADGCFFG